MLNKYGERTQSCWTPSLTQNHSDSVSATLTLATCFLYSLASKSIKCLLETYEAHIEWLLMLTSLVHQYSEIRDFVSCPSSLLESH